MLEHLGIGPDPPTLLHTVFCLVDLSESREVDKSLQYSFFMLTNHQSYDISYIE